MADALAPLSRRLCLALGATMMSMTILAAPPATSSPAAEIKRFIACPVYRDTDAGRKSGCWLAVDLASGVRYDVTGALIKPLLGREVLVEGALSDEDPAACGGVILDPISVSVLDSECKAHLIPPDGHPGRRFVLPARTLQPTWVPREPPPPPYEPRAYTMYFELNSDFLLYQHAEVIIDDAVTYIKASQPARVLITGFADTQGFEASGRRIAEDIAVAGARARMLQEALLRLGVPRDIIELQWRGEPEPDGHALPLQSKRRVTLDVEF